MASVLIPLVNGFEEIEAMTCVDVLRRGSINVSLAAVGDKLEVVGAHGVHVLADVTLDEVADFAFDAILLPGGPGTPAFLESRRLTEMLSRHRGEGRLLAAICAAPTVLTKLGLVDEGLHITCYPSCAAELDRQCADAPVVSDGNIISGEAPGSAMLFALVVLQHLAGDRAASGVANGLVTDVLE